MSMSTCVHGFKPPDERFNQMYKTYFACQEANVMIPKEVIDFFDGERPDKAGVKISLSNDKKYKNAVKEFNDDTGQGYEINLEKLPQDIKIVKFTNNW